MPRQKQQHAARVEATFFHAEITVNGVTRVIEQNHIRRELRNGVWVDAATGKPAASPFAGIGAALAGMFAPAPTAKRIESKEVRKP